MTARPDELSFFVFMDYTNCTNDLHVSYFGFPGNTLPLGVEIQQINYMFNCFPLSNMYFTKYRIINKSSQMWDSLYVSNINDVDLGGYYDDVCGCDTSKSLSFTYNSVNYDELYGTNPPAIGVSFLQSPLIHTGNNNDTAKLPYDTLTGFKMTGLSGFNKFLNYDYCLWIPDNAIQAYNFMRGKDGCGNNLTNWVTGQTTTYRYSGNACSHAGWYDSIGGDKHTIANMGPLTMNSGDTQIIVMSYMITRDGGNNLQNVCALQSISDSALKYYYNDFRTCIPIGIQSISTEIPTKYELFQNYPNPFNPVTKIRFNIPKTPLSFGEGLGVGLKIHDVLGKEIVVLINENLKPGIYEIDWNAENIPSGVYFYSLITNNFTQTKRMVVLK